MKSLSILACVGALACAGAAASAQLVSPDAEFGAAYVKPHDVTTVIVDLEQAQGPLYFLLVSVSDFQTLPVLLGPYPLDPDGTGVFMADIPQSLESQLPDKLKIAFRPLFLNSNYASTTNPASIVLNDAGCEPIDFDLKAGGAPTQAGEVVLEQWAPIGLHITCDSQLPTQPNKCEVFDSGNPTGGDTDLATPGYGPNNTVALGKLLVVAENDVDANNDGLIDSPDDAFNGGIMHFNWDQPVDVCSATFVDVDDVDPGQGITRLRFWKDNAGTDFIGSIICPPGPDNNVTKLFFKVADVRRMDVKMGGSGGLGGVSWCPTCINFDDTGMGIPLNLKAGTEIKEQFASLGVHVSCKNQAAGHPNKAIIFDSDNPTGGDTDLATPGYGFGNTIAEHKIIVIAENDVDANNDGLVDDPDDEAKGGNIFFDFDFPVEIESLTFIDVDGLEASWVQCIDNSNQIVGTVPLANLGDNSRQTIAINLTNVIRFKVHFGGSGSVAGFCFCSDPPNAAN
jgi:hypothetical protein